MKVLAKETRDSIQGIFSRKLLTIFSVPLIGLTAPGTRRFTAKYPDAESLLSDYEKGERYDIVFCVLFKKIIIKSFRESVIVKSEYLIYIEVKDKYSFVHYWTEENLRREETTITASSLHHLEETLTDKNFYRIHRKYYINMEHVVSYNSMSVLMDCGTALPISYRKSGAFKDAFEAFL